MSRKHTPLLVAILLGGFVTACTAPKQLSNTSGGTPQLRITGNGISDSEMNHSQMGGRQGPSGTPEMRVTGNGLAGAEMDHSQMGASQNRSGGAPQFRVTGNGLAGAEMDHSRMGGGQNTGTR